ncbi:MAG: type II toxin-antitoxin system HicB family antitoxin [bacterium]|nr:type II toxin-antitoxin system HicB family antitoxin [bacterium]MDE0674445.1 type II toxin-antitoxin system HicB family antitoxin [bacterium]
MSYTAVIEKTNNGYSAYVPDLPGCVATADTYSEVRELIAESVRLHVGSLREHGDPIPEPQASVTTVSV